MRKFSNLSKIVFLTVILLITYTLEFLLSSQIPHKKTICPGKKAAA